MTRARLAAAAVVVGVVLVHVLAPLWVEIAAGLVLAVVWAAWASRPVGVPLRRHLAALAGQVILDAVRGALRTVLALFLVAAVVAGSWSFLAPRIADHLAVLRHQAVADVKDAVTPDLPTPNVRGWLDQIRGTRP
jgi:hypothetical protein